MRGSRSFSVFVLFLVLFGQLGTLNQHSFDQLTVGFDVLMQNLKEKNIYEFHWFHKFSSLFKIIWRMSFANDFMAKEIFLVDIFSSFFSYLRCTFHHKTSFNVCTSTWSFDWFDLFHFIGPLLVLLTDIILRSIS